MSDSFDFSSPDLFTAGAIGPPGQRVFYLQAREGDALVTLKCEKEQVRVLRRVPRPPARAAVGAGFGPGSDLALVEPLTPAWIVGSIGVGYDEATDRVVLVIEEVREQEEAESEESEQEAEPDVHAESEPPSRPSRKTRRRRRRRAIGRRDASTSPGSRWRRSWPGRAPSSRAGARRAGSAAGR